MRLFPEIIAMKIYAESLEQSENLKILKHDLYTKHCCFNEL